MIVFVLTTAVVFGFGYALYIIGKAAAAIAGAGEDEEPTKPAQPPASADPCIALTVDVTNKRRAAEDAKATKDRNTEKLEELRDQRGIALAAALAAAAVLAATVIFQWYNPWAIASATAAAAAAIVALGAIDELIQQRTNLIGSIERAIAAAEDAVKDAEDAFNDAGCAAPRDGVTPPSDGGGFA